MNATEPADELRVCPLHGEPWVPGLHFGRRGCLFYIPEFGASEDYGCPQEDDSE